MTFTLEDLASRVKQFAQEQPDRTASCVYITPSGSCECVVGQALVDLGVPKKLLRKHNTRTIRQLLLGKPMLVGFEVAPLGDYVTTPRDLDPDNEPNLVYLTKVQDYQDQGRSWRVADIFARNGIGWPPDRATPDGYLINYITPEQYIEQNGLS